MSPSLSDVLSGLQQAAAAATQARDLKSRRKTEDGRRIYRIACLGHANSGKTTFWTVLEGSTKNSSDKFNLQSGDNATAAYLMRQVESMEQGALWIAGDDEKVGETPGVYEPGYPQQTDLVAELLFMARQPGKPEFPILVQDYPGGSIAVEDLEGGSASVAEFLKSADGILFLIDSIVTRLARVSIDQQLAGFRSLLRQIEDRHGRIQKPVGIVFTKADTLPGYRKGVPVALLQPSDLRRRHEPFSKFLDQLLRGGPYAQDPAWRDRVNKTMSRVQSFADMLLKKCDSPQLFFVSAVGHKRRRPIEASTDLEGSIVSSRVGSVPGRSSVLGKHQVGLGVPVEWIANELSVMTTVNRVHRIRNRALKIALTWSILVSLTFMTYLGCETAAVVNDLRADRIPAEKTLHDVHRLEHAPYASLWNRFDPSGFMATAREGRNVVASEVRIAAGDSLVSLLQSAEDASVQPSPTLAASCSQWVDALRKCSRALPETTVSSYKEDALRILCLSQLYDDLGRALQAEDMGDRRYKLETLSRDRKACLTDGIQAGIDRLIHRVLKVEIDPKDPTLDAGKVTISASVDGGTKPYALTWIGPTGTGPFEDNKWSIEVGVEGPYRLIVTDSTGAKRELPFTVGGPKKPLSERYNDLLKRYGSLMAPVARVRADLISELRALVPQEPPPDGASQEAAKRISAFLQEAGKFVDGVNLKLRIRTLSDPARLKLSTSPSEPPHVQGDTVVIPDWKLDKPVQVRIVMDNKEELLPIPNLVEGNNKSYDFPKLTARGGGSVSFIYEIAEPALDSIPQLEEVR